MKKDELAHRDSEIQKLKLHNAKLESEVSRLNK